MNIFHVSKSQAKALIAKTKERKLKRDEKRKIVFSGRPTVISLSALKKRAWSLKSLRIRLEGKRVHSFCLICLWETSKGLRTREHCRPIQDAGHKVPKSRGLSIYFHDDNLMAICKPHNWGDMMNRSQYREKYVAMFGLSQIEMLESLAHESKKLSRSDYLQIISDEKKKIEALK